MNSTPTLMPKPSSWWYNLQTLWSLSSQLPLSLCVLWQATLLRLFLCQHSFYLFLLHNLKQGNGVHFRFSCLLSYLWCIRLLWGRCLISILSLLYQDFYCTHLLRRCIVLQEQFGHICTFHSPYLYICFWQSAFWKSRCLRDKCASPHTHKFIYFWSFCLFVIYQWSLLTRLCTSFLLLVELLFSCLGLWLLLSYTIWPSHFQLRQTDIHGSWPPSIK